MPSLELFAELFVVGTVAWVGALVFFHALTVHSSGLSRFLRILRVLFRKEGEVHKILAGAIVIACTYAAGVLADQLGFVAMDTPLAMNIIGAPADALQDFFPLDIREPLELSANRTQSIALSHRGWSSGTYRYLFRHAIQAGSRSEIPRGIWLSSLRHRDPACVPAQSKKSVSTTSTETEITGTAPPESKKSVSITSANSETSVSTIDLTGAKPKADEACEPSVVGRACLGRAICEAKDDIDKNQEACKGYSGSLKTPDDEKSNEIYKDCNFLNLWLQHEKGDSKSAARFKRTNTIYQIARSLMSLSLAALLCILVVLWSDLIKYYSRNDTAKFLSLPTACIACASVVALAYPLFTYRWVSWGVVACWCLSTAWSLGFFRVLKDLGSGNQPTGDRVGGSATAKPPTKTGQEIDLTIITGRFQLLLAAYFIGYCSYVAMIRAEIDFHADVWFSSIETIEKTDAKKKDSDD